jgi:poly-gamma-glutamate synthesis protein (capsule biosynthesis protein)
MAGAFRAAGFDLVNLANNHMFDQMREGVVETVENTKKAGLEPFGAGASQDEAKKPLILEAGGARVAFLGWTFALNRNLLDKHKDKPWVMKWSAEWAEKAVKDAREKADLVIVSMHWGSEFGLKVQGHQKEAAKLLCGAGADLVVGSGPHVLQPVRNVKDPGSGRTCLVTYSLGNVLSNQGLKYRYGWKPPDLVQAKNVPYTRDGLLLRVTFAGRGGAAEVEKIEGVPLWTENNWILRYKLKTIPPDRIWIQPILPLLKGLGEDNHRKLLEQRLPIIKDFVGDLVDYVEI